MKGLYFKAQSTFGFQCLLELTLLTIFVIHIFLALIPFQPLIKMLNKVT